MSTSRSRSADGRVAVVTGAAGGIGQALARRLATDGHRVAIADVSTAEATVELIDAAGGEALGVHCDVSVPEDVHRLSDSVHEAWGRCDVLVANAGIYPVVPIAETTWEIWRRIMSVNLDSLFLLTQAFLPGMRERRWGRIVATATNGFHTGLPDLTAYVASKGGVVGFIRSLAGEVGVDGVTVNAIAPSLTRTHGTESGPHQEMGLFDFTRALQAIKRTQEPEDLAGAVSFLVSDDAEFITGQTLPVDGGLVRV